MAINVRFLFLFSTFLVLIFTASVQDVLAENVNPKVSQSKKLALDKIIFSDNGELRSVNFSGLFFDPDDAEGEGDPLTYSFTECTDKAIASCMLENETRPVIQITPVKGATGKILVKLIARDSRKGVSEVVIFNWPIAEYTPLVTKQPAIFEDKPGSNRLINLFNFFEDGNPANKDKQNLEFVIGSPIIDKDKIIAHKAITGKTLGLIYTDNIGQASIPLIAKNSEGVAVSRNFQFETTDDSLRAFKSEKTSIAWLELGVQMMPDYDSTGASNGLSNSRGFGRVMFNEKLDNGEWGWRLTLGSTPSVNDKKPSVPNSFNDVSDTINVSVKRYFSVTKVASWAPDFSKNWTAGFSIGMENREQLGKNKDSLGSFGSIGFRYELPLKFNRGEGTSSQGNSVPETYFDISVAKYEDYGGLNKGKFNTRIITEVGYRIPNKNILLLFSSNAGEGPDEIAIGLSILFQMHKMVDLFGFDLSKQ